MSESFGPLVVDSITNEAIEFRDDVSSDCLGVHFMCKGFVYMRPVSQNWNALYCKNCGLRKLFPASIDLDVYDREDIWIQLSKYFQIEVKEDRMRRGLEG